MCGARFVTGFSDFAYVASCIAHDQNQTMRVRGVKCAEFRPVRERNHVGAELSRVELRYIFNSCTKKWLPNTTKNRYFGINVFVNELIFMITWLKLTATT